MPTDAQVDVLIEISPHSITVNPHQPRRHFARDELEDLANSIKSCGIIHPPLVRLVNEKTYEIIAGERRVRAALLAGLKKIPVLVRKTSSKLSAKAALMENIQRVDLNPMEIAKALKKLMEESQLQQEELAIDVGKKRSTVANYLRLLTLPQNIQECVSSGKITMGHAKAILYLPDAKKQNILLDKVLSKDLTVRQTEQMAKKIGAKERKKTTEDPIFLQEVAEKLQSKFGTKVTLKGKGKKGVIHIHYYDLNDLERVLEVFDIG